MMYLKDKKHVVKVRLDDDDYNYLSVWASIKETTISDCIRSCIGHFRRLDNDKQAHINNKL